MTEKKVTKQVEVRMHVADDLVLEKKQSKTNYCGRKGRKVRN